MTKTSKEDGIVDLRGFIVWLKKLVVLKCSNSILMEREKIEEFLQRSDIPWQHKKEVVVPLYIAYFQKGMGPYAMELLQELIRQGKGIESKKIIEHDVMTQIAKLEAEKNILFQQDGFSVINPTEMGRKFETKPEKAV